MRSVGAARGGRGAGGEGEVDAFRAARNLNSVSLFAVWKARVSAL